MGQTVLIGFFKKIMTQNIVVHGVINLQTIYQLQKRLGSIKKGLLKLINVI